MAKKKSKKNRKIIEQNEVEPIEGYISESEPVSDEIEVVPPDVSPDSVEVVHPAESDQDGEDVPAAEDDISADDLLDDVRRSLIEANTKVEGEQKKPRWWQRIRVGGQKGMSHDEPTPVIESPEDSDVADIGSIDEEQEEVGESIDELIDMLETDDEEILSELETPSEVIQVEQEEPIPEPEVEKVDVEEQKKRAFKGSTTEDKEESFSDVRSVALEGGEEVFVEVEVKSEDQVEERLKSFENALRPYRRYIYFGIAFIGIVVIVITSGLLYDAYKQTLPPEPVKEIEALPYPVILHMPGDISFNLERGSLDNGRWNPRGPQWLEGTEICRWVAIPYSRQMEAVVRTLTREDKFELVMSNDDRWTYDVYSITQMTLEDMQKVSSNSPCLLLVLAEEDTDTRWVVTAYP